MQQMDLDLPEQHPVLDDSDVTLRWKKNRYRRRGLVSHTASYLLATFHFTHTDVIGENLLLIAHPRRALIYAVVERVYCACWHCINVVYMCAHVAMCACI